VVIHFGRLARAESRGDLGLPNHPPPEGAPYACTRQQGGASGATPVRSRRL